MGALGGLAYGLVFDILAAELAKERDEDQLRDKFKNMKIENNLLDYLQ